MDQTEKSSVNYNQFKPIYGHMSWSQVKQIDGCSFNIQHDRLHSFLRKRKKTRYSWISFESQVSVRQIACHVIFTLILVP